MSCGVLPVEAQGDIEILGLMGHLAVCPDELQNSRTIIEHNLAFYSEGFHGWSALARSVCSKYNLPDPLEYFQYPWRPDRRQVEKTLRANSWALLGVQIKGYSQTERLPGTL